MAHKSAINLRLKICNRIHPKRLSKWAYNVWVPITSMISSELLLFHIRWHPISDSLSCAFLRYNRPMAKCSSSGAMACCQVPAEYYAILETHHPWNYIYSVYKVWLFRDFEALRLWNVLSGWVVLYCNCLMTALLRWRHFWFHICSRYVVERYFTSVFA